MGRRSRSKEQNPSRETDLREKLLEKPSTFFEDFRFSLDELRIQWGMLSVTAIQDLQLSNEELSAMLLSQLDLRDAFIEMLGARLLAIVAKGHSLEDHIRYLLNKIKDVSRNYEEKSKYYSSGNRAHPGDSGVLRVKSEHSQHRNESLNHYEHRSSSNHSSDNYSFSHSTENADVKVKSESKSDDDEDDDKDKFKALVAMAFEAHGLDLPGSGEPGKSQDSDLSEEEKPSGDSGWREKEGKSITDQVEAAASKAVVQSGYVFHEESGLYYDHTSGYYYNAENGLYYDPKTGTYFYYDHAKQSYQFHSQIQVEGDGNSGSRQNVDGGQAAAINTGGFSSMNFPEDQGKIPPSIRLMVTESGVDTVKVGDLHLVTIIGGRVGTNTNNLIQLMDDDVSEEHAEFSYKSDGPEDHHYFVKDLGSENGTFINGTCICVPGEPSDEVEVGHGWELQFGSVKLKCHIHPGYLSCNECEPGLVLANQPQLNDEFRKVKASAEKMRRKALKALKKKYGVEVSKPVQLPADYEDRASKRRKEKGSDNPYEKTEVASTQVALKDTNKGFKMLKKMGWSKGETLGKSQPGIVNPIEASSTVGREGLGFSSGLPPPTPSNIKRKKILDVTVQRFKNV
ncbi:angiogenic factor with G patch and FHA domains 1-like [Palaemon carinicauda]|uniref:angiogenic factor with G patch and FHA domains 1-like n=1 Tax=Palaemon carinicauda TaxID=392227 RepID=UPI0035B5EE06